MPEPIGLSGEQLSRLYRERFTESDLEFKAGMWKVFCEEFFQRYVEPTDTVVDLGAGTCEFINAINCANKIAVDLNPDVERNVRDGKAVIASSNSMPEIPTGTVDVVFTSNFFEHLPNKGELVDTLAECHRILRPGGQLIVVMPNIRYLPGRYWDYFDHHLALTHFSLAEALALSGFRPEVVIPRFLPYTIKHSRTPRRLGLVRLYMRVPFVWKLMGKQMFVVGRRVDLDVAEGTEPRS
ncbi:MAG: methyltransferase domain-containing protein [Acidimicrobiia bacterium]